MTKKDDLPLITPVPGSPVRDSAPGPVPAPTAAETRRRLGPFLVALACLTATTWALGLLDIQFRGVGAAAFEPGGFPGPAESWTLRGDPARLAVSDGAIRLDGARDARLAASRAFALEPGLHERGLKLRVRGTVTTERHPSLPLSERRSAAFIVWFLDAAGRDFAYRTVRSLNADLGEHRTGRVVDVPRRATELVVALIGRDSDGAFTLSEVSVERVETTVFYYWVFAALLVLWASICALVAHAVYRSGARWPTFIVAALLLLTFVGVLIPEGLGGRFVLPLYYRTALLLQPYVATPFKLFYKGGHFLFFLGLAGVLFALAPRLRASDGAILVALLLTAIGTEGLQLYLFDRTTRLGDVAIDSAGIALALITVRLVRRRAR